MPLLAPVTTATLPPRSFPIVAAISIPPNRGAAVAALCRSAYCYRTQAWTGTIYPMIAAVSQVFATAALGAVSGVFGGLFGIGGGVLAIPLLGMVFGLEQQAAQGTTLIMVVPNVLFGFWRYRQRFGVDLRMAAVIAGSALVSTYPTARFATGLDQ